MRVDIAAARRYVVDACLIRRARHASSPIDALILRLIRRRRRACYMLLMPADYAF